MADLNPISLWKKLLAAPNDSREKTIGMAFIVAVVCAVFVTGATVILRPIQAANRAAEEAMKLDALVAAIPGMQEIMQGSETGALSTVVIDLDTGQAATEVTPDTLEAALKDPANWTALTAEQDIAGIGSRPDYAQIYLLRDGDAVTLAILPIAGAGYNGPIQAMLAVRGDMNTIAGIAITEQSETPGLGARITEDAWQQSFAGTRIRDDSGAVRFSVARGPANTDYEVDGITGATRTSNAIGNIVRFWVGPEGYGPFMDAVRKGEF